MRIYELFEQTVGTVPPGQPSPLPATTPTQAPPKQTTQANTATQATSTGTAVALKVPGVGQPMGQPVQSQQAQHGLEKAMVDLDKITAQLVGLKQQQQKLQQQLQTTTPKS